MQVNKINIMYLGVDSNRNFDANFGGIGSSDDPCSEVVRNLEFAH